MLTTRSRSEPKRADNDEPDALMHAYPAATAEWRVPRIGDVARCGYVKRGPTGGPGKWGTSEVCIVCEHLCR